MIISEDEEFAYDDKYLYIENSRYLSNSDFGDGSLWFLGPQLNCETAFMKLKTM